MDEGERRAAREHELRNLDVIFEILAGNDEVAVEEVRAVHGLSPEKTLWLRHYARLRYNVLNEDQTRVDRRKRERPEMTEEERALGCYAESIEPQVRDAVFAARRKGYQTIASGFDDVGELQHLHFAAPQDPSILPPSIVESLAKRGVRVRLSSRGEKLVFDTDAMLSLEELRSVWKEITDAMPDLGRPAEPSDMPVAKRFRKKERPRD